MINQHKTGYTVNQIADWYLSKSSMSPKKLQKILYYAYAWVLTLSNDDINHLENKLFDDDIEAWAHGPVIYTVYEEYKLFGYNDIPRYDGEVVMLSEDISDILNQVWDEYGSFTADQLESITHQESPWIHAREGVSPLAYSDKAISDRDIYKCYIERIA